MSNIKVRLTLNGINQKDEKPVVALYTLNEKGIPQKKIVAAENEEIKIPKKLKEQQAIIALGPDVEDFKNLDTETLIKFDSKSFILDLELKPEIEIPELQWKPWQFFKVCVSGKVQKCFFPFFPFPIPVPNPILQTPINPLIKLNGFDSKMIKAQQTLDFLSPPILQKCLPLCHGIVEIYEQTCCCNIWDIIPDIPELIPEIPFPIDPPIPPTLLPIPNFPKIPTLNNAINVERKENVLLKNDAVQLDEATIADLKTLISIKSQEAQFEFIEKRPQLIPVLCGRRNCTSKKVGETKIGFDGKFSFCYLKPFQILLPFKSCTTTYYYKVKQNIDGVDTYVYDGSVAKQFFAKDEAAKLTTFHRLAETCETPEPPVPGDNYVMLQEIGNTDSYELNSEEQNGASSIPDISENSGLLKFSNTENCPLAKTLNLRLYFDAGLEAADINYYKLSIIPVDNNGLVTGNKQTLTEAKAWRKFSNDGQANIVAELLGPKMVDTQNGLYKIPYVNDNNRWLGGQFHYSLNTSSFSNGKYLLVLELFDSNGNKLIPSNALDAGAGIAKPFIFKKWEDRSTTKDILYSDLTHVIHINNTPCVGEIIDLRLNGVVNEDENNCQFIEDTSNGSTPLSLGFRAYQEDGFMKNYLLQYQKGLNGSLQKLDMGTTNVPPGLPSFNDIGESASKTIAELLGEDDKCTFSLKLTVEAKHTNGSGFIRAYNEEDIASFAASIVPAMATT